MRVIFIDVDGVVAPMGRPNPGVVSAAAMAELKRVVDETGAELALVSSWPDEDAQELFEHHQMHLDHFLGEDRSTYVGRPREIHRFVTQHQLSDDDWVWIDDDEHPLGDPQVSVRPSGLTVRYREVYPLSVERHIQPDWFWSGTTGEVRGEGFTRAMADRAVALLRPK